MTRVIVFGVRLWPIRWGFVVETAFLVVADLLLLGLGLASLLVVLPRLDVAWGRPVLDWASVMYQLFSIDERWPLVAFCIVWYCTDRVRSIADALRSGYGS